MSAVVVLWGGQWACRLGVSDLDEVTLSSISVDPPSSKAALVNAIVQTLEQHNIRVDAVVLGLDSTQCLCARMLAVTAAEREYTALAYRLEEHVPLAAEMAVADFVLLHNEAFGCAVPLAEVSEFVDALEDAGLRVDAICPTFLMAVQETLLHLNLTPAIAAVAWERDEVADLLALRDEQPRAWFHLTDATTLTEALLRTIYESGNDNGQLLLVNPSPQLKAIAGRLQLPTRIAEHDLDAAAVKWADHRNKGQSIPWLDFRRAKLAPLDRWRAIRRQVDITFYAVAILLLAFAIAALIRARRYVAQTESHEQHLVQLYRETFPGDTVPSRIAAVLKSDRLRLEQHRTEVSALVLQRNALHSLLDVLRAVPLELRFQLQTIDVTPTSVRLVGQVREVGDANRLAAELEKMGYETTVPRDATAFTITGQLVRSKE